MDATVDTENRLLTYLKNILKYQIIPMDFMDLRGLVKEAPNNTHLYEFIEENYPGEQFMSFLKKYPDIFIFNKYRNVILSQANSFALPHASTDDSSDQVDSGVVVDEYDWAEYISDPDSENSDAEEDQLLNNKEKSERTEPSFNITSTESESSLAMVSSELVHASDASHSSLTSGSSEGN